MTMRSVGRKVDKVGNSGKPHYVGHCFYVSFMNVYVWYGADYNILENGWTYVYLLFCKHNTKTRLISLHQLPSFIIRFLNPYNFL